MKKKIIAAIFIIAACLTLSYFSYERLVLYPFALSHIVPSHSAALHIAASNIPTEDENKIQQVLKQSFSYLGQGHQTYAFLSEDKQYVLKFFNFARMEAREPIEWLPSVFFIADIQNHTQKRRIKKFNRVFIGYKTAYEDDRDNTGVVYVHLQKTHYLQRDVFVKDNKHNSYRISLDDTIFIVQKKIDLTREVLNNLLKQNDIPGFKKRISQIISLYLSEYKRGLYDSDHNIMSNTGFDAERAYRLDVGRLTHNDDIHIPEQYKADLQKIMDKRILKWIHKKYPKYYEELYKDIKNQLSLIE
jgi:hypothetical protein